MPHRIPTDNPIQHDPERHRCRPASSRSWRTSPNWRWMVPEKLILVIQIIDNFVELGGLARAHGAQIALRLAGPFECAVRDHLSRIVPPMVPMGLCRGSGEDIQIKVGRVWLGHTGVRFLVSGGKKMFKLNRLVTMLLLVAFVGVAWGAATKIPSFEIEDTATSCSGVCSDTGGPCTNAFPCPSGAACDGIGDPFPLTLDPAADGMAILNYVSGTNKTIVQVIVSNFSGAPLGRFIVRLDPDVGDLGTFLVDSQGNGHFHGEIGGNHSTKNVKLFQQAQVPPCPADLIATGSQ